MHTWTMLAGGAVLAGLASHVAGPAEAPAEAPGTLRTAAPMHVERAAHTATTLADGRVLVVGGFTQSGAAPDAEFFDPARGAFAAAPPMQTVRHSHTATALPDGRVLIAGGYGEGNRTLASAEVFDPRASRFTPVGAMQTARANHVAVALEDGQVLVVGGLGTGWTYLASAEIFDPVRLTFTPVGAMSVPREGHAAVRLADGRVLMAGGHMGPRGQLTLHTSAETYDPSTRTFRRTGDLTVRRHKHDVVRLRDGRVLVTGGADERDGDGAYTSTELFDPRTGRFTAGAHMRHARYKHLGTTVLLDDGRVLVAGGAAVAEVYDPTRQTFAEVPGDTPLPGLFAAVAPYGSNRVFVSGGYGRGQGPTRAAWLYAR